MRCASVPAPLDLHAHDEKADALGDGPTSGWSVRCHIHARVPCLTSGVTSTSIPGTEYNAEKGAVPHVEWRIEGPQPRRTVRGMYMPLRKRDFLLMIPGIALAVVCGGIPISMTYVLGRAFRALGQYDPSAGAAAATRLMNAMRDDCAGLVGLAAAALVLRAIDTYIWLVIGERGAHAWRTTTMQAVVEKDASWFDLGMGLGSDTGAAGLMSMYASETDDVRLAMGIHMGGIVRHLATVLIATAFALSRQWALTLVIYATVPLVIVITAAGDRLAAPLEGHTRQQTRELASRAEKSLRAIHTVKAYTWESGHFDMFAACAHTLRRVHARWATVLGVRMGLGAAVSLLTFVQGFGYGSVLVKHGKADASVVLSTFLACLVAMSQLQTILQRLVGLERGKGAAVRLSQVQTSEVVRVPCREGLCATPPLPSLKVPQPLKGLGHIRLEDVWMAYPTRPSVYALADMCLSIEAGACTYIVGESGSGKSSIGALVTRLYEPVHGRVYVDGMDVRVWPRDDLHAHVACVRQEPLILEGSVRMNLAPTGRASDSAIDAVCRAVRLDEMVATLPSGLDTVLGLRGVELSGGQKQRIALARALLMDPAVLVLDEATSALDRGAAMAVHAAVKAWRHGKTTVVITHDLSLILPHEEVYVVRDGHVVEHGTLSTLVYAQGAVPSYASHDETLSACWATQSAPPSYRGHASRASTPVVLDMPASMPMPTPTPTPTPTLSQALAWMWSTLPTRMGLCVGLAVCIASGVTVPAFSLCLTQVLVAVAQPGGAHVGAMVGVTAGVAVADGVLKSARHAGMDALACAWIERVRRRMMRALLRQDCAFYDEQAHAPSTLTSTLVKDADDARVLVSELVGQGAVVLAMALGTLVWSLIRGWHLTLCALAILLIGAGVQCVHGAWLARSEAHAMLTRTCAAERVYDYAVAQRGARSMALDGVLCMAASDASRAAHAAGVRTAGAIACGAGTADAVMYAAEAILYALGAFLLTHGTYDLRRVLDVLSPLVFTMAYAASASAVMPAAGQCLSALGRVRRVAALSAQDASDAKGTRAWPGASDEAAALRSVSFAYGTAARTLCDVSLCIRTGEKVALVGRSGCGKTTILRLLQRLYEPQSGQVRIGGVDAASLAVSELRRHVAVVGQHPTLFPGTIAANIAAGQPLAERGVADASRRACAAAFIEALPERYATCLGTQTALSGGEAQRIEWARAFARQAAALWLMDEPTAALDHATRDAVLAQLWSLPVSAVIVTHDVHVMEQCDRVLVLDEGRIVAEGPWRDVSALPALHYHHHHHHHIVRQEGNI